jgi:hypothetical protein
VDVKSSARSVCLSGAARPVTRRSRWWCTVVVGSLAFLLGGCVYLRLLELKRQFEHFDHFFALNLEDGLRISCQTPVLRTSDVRWIGLKPETTRKLGQAEQWQVRWVKQVPMDAPPEKQQFDIIIELSFVEDLLTRVAIPERYFAVMPKKFLVSVLKSLAGARVDQAGRKLEAEVSAEEMAAARPNLPGIDKLLGRPSEERVEGPLTIVRYRYVPATKESRAGVFDMTLQFNTATGELLRWNGRTPIGNIGFNFAKPTAEKTNAVLPAARHVPP